MEVGAKSDKVGDKLTRCMGEKMGVVAGLAGRGVDRTGGGVKAEEF